MLSIHGSRVELVGQNCKFIDLIKLFIVIEFPDKFNVCGDWHCKGICHLKNKDNIMDTTSMEKSLTFSKMDHNKFCMVIMIDCHDNMDDPDNLPTWIPTSFELEMTNLPSTQIKILFLENIIQQIYYSHGPYVLSA